MNRQILLATRPEGAPGPQHLRPAETPVPQPGDGQVLLKTLWLSLDPYIRGRMSAAHALISNLERHWNAHQRVA
jgi:NADPH-dependent curcumin reductase CurA